MNLVNHGGQRGGREGPRQRDKGRQFWITADPRPLWGGSDSVPPPTPPHPPHRPHTRALHWHWISVSEGSSLHPSSAIIFFVNPWGGVNEQTLQGAERGAGEQALKIELLCDRVLIIKRLPSNRGRIKIWITSGLQVSGYCLTVGEPLFWFSSFLNRLMK